MSHLKYNLLLPVEILMNIIIKKIKEWLVPNPMVHSELYILTRDIAVPTTHYSFICHLKNALPHIRVGGTGAAMKQMVIRKIFLLENVYSKLVLILDFYFRI